MDNGKRDLESFTDWKERFEMATEACHWDQFFIGHVMKVSGQTTQGLSNC